MGLLNLKCYFDKVQLFWEGFNNLKKNQSSTLFWLLSNVKKGKIDSNFVAISQYLNFTAMI